MVRAGGANSRPVRAKIRGEEGGHQRRFCTERKRGKMERGRGPAMATTWRRGRRAR
jgi:hypothetical protein